MEVIAITKIYNLYVMFPEIMSIFFFKFTKIFEIHSGYSEMPILDNLRTRSKGEQSTLFLLHKEIVNFESSLSEFSIFLMQEE
jgi:hypothetical protein